ncbi:UDP-glucose:undecaprenyl-phosphate glucose-1-phosphate transferase [Corynebacterium capitovis DSM 44611]|uniref:sugar transferase n=1 Tax=Corynebacterium capitovis TaxID=131081 RepID=UPI00036AE7A3|nr:sugar transferase [Corynebacterium capitovis]WKD57217.1 UDP-glucose:undecaprenyl-phosphate glucose-1-phosphate transferase [Corynebacterium capitovis DSM 44611]
MSVQNREIEQSRPTRVAFDLDPAHRLCDALICVIASFVSHGRSPIALAVVMIIGLQFAANFYRNRITLSTIDEFPRIAITGGAVAFISAVLTDQGWTSRGTLAYCVLVVASMVVGRIMTNGVIRTIRKRDVDKRKRTVILGSGPTGWDIGRILCDKPELGLYPVAVVDKNVVGEGERPAELPVKRIERGGLKRFLTRVRVRTLLVADSNYDKMEILDLLRECTRLDTEIFIVPELADYVSLEGTMDRVRSYPLTRVRRAAYRSLTWRLKRPLGMLLSGAALVVLSPLFAILALLIKAGDPSAPVLFRQIRVGVDERPFELYKFRSMTPKNVQESDTTWNIAGDPRITRVGAFMRKYSLDELPQIYNVFRGDMALVGPRPERPVFVQQFNEELAGYRARHRVPVGLTGWAAANGLRGDTSIRERVQFDNFYIENWSLWLDFKILVLTIGAVFKGSGS